MKCDVPRENAQRLDKLEKIALEQRERGENLAEFTETQIDVTKGMHERVASCAFENPAEVMAVETRFLDRYINAMEEGKDPEWNEVKASCAERTFDEFCARDAASLHVHRDLAEAITEEKCELTEKDYATAEAPVLEAGEKNADFEITFFEQYSDGIPLNDWHPMRDFRETTIKEWRQEAWDSAQNQCAEAEKGLNLFSPVDTDDQKGLDLFSPGDGVGRGLDVSSPPDRDGQERLHLFEPVETGELSSSMEPNSLDVFAPAETDDFGLGLFEPSLREAKFMDFPQHEPPPPVEVEPEIDMSAEAADADGADGGDGGGD